MTTRDLLKQIRFARFYTTRLLDATPREDWLRVPPAGVSHIAWQAGHLAMAGYRLALDRLRGRAEGDEALISDAILARFGRESVPGALGEITVDDLAAAYARVHDRIQEELSGVSDDLLGMSLLKPHSLCKTRGEVLAWCAQHEMLHAGQIGLLRRQLGHPAVW